MSKSVCEVSSFPKEPFVVATVCGGNHVETGCKVVDVDLRPASDVDLIKFRNMYTYSVSVLYKSTSANSGWVMGIKDWVCMREGCHCEQGGQSWVVLDKKHFVRNFENVSQIRLLLKQPSPHWRSFGVELLSFYCHGNERDDQLLVGSTQSEFVSAKLEDMCRGLASPSTDTVKIFSDISVLATD